MLQMNELEKQFTMERSASAEELERYSLLEKVHAASHPQGFMSIFTRKLCLVCTSVDILLTGIARGRDKSSQT